MIDADLAIASMRGDRDAYAALIERHARMVAGVAFAAAGDAAIVDDVVQDTFVAAWQQLATLRDPARVRPWLRRIAKNVARNARRQRRRDADMVELASDATPFDDVANRERERALATAIATLAARYREPLVLFYFEQQSIREVAAALGLGEAAVMQRLARARKQLGAALADDVASDLTRRGAAPISGVAAAVLALIGTSHAAGATTAAASAARWVSHATALRVAASIGVLAAGAWLASRAVATSHAGNAAALPPMQHDRSSTPTPARSLPRNSASAPQPRDGAGDGDSSGDGSGMTWAAHTLRNMVVAVDDPIETCRRGTMGLAVATLAGPNAPRFEVPSARVMSRAAELADQIAQSCAGGETWPTLWAICEASPIDILDGKINCYPYDVFD